MTTIDENAQEQRLLALSEYEIAISDQQHLIVIPPERIEAIVRDVLTREQVARADVSIALIDSETMRRINHAHLGHDYDTDVLSFLLDSTPDDSVDKDARAAGKSIEGDILVSTSIARGAADEHDWPAADEVALYVVHGLLHLLGYDDLCEDERKIMIARERFHLARWDLTPPGRGESSGS